MEKVINGFTVEKYNIYNFPEGVKTHTCPICSKTRNPHNQKVKCVNVYWDTGYFHCSHCGAHENMHSFKKEQQEKQYKRPVWNNNTNLPDSIIKYFEGRGISQFTIRALRITKSAIKTQEGSKTSINYNYFKNGDLVNVKYRARLSNGKRVYQLFGGGELIPYNYDNIITANECIIVEGEEDALSYCEAGFFNTVSVPNGANANKVNLTWLDNSIDAFDNKDKIYLALDKDEPGQNTQKEIIRRLGPHRCYQVDLLDCKDANEFLCKHGKEALKKTIADAKPVPLENVVTINDFRAEMEAYFLGEQKKGYVTGIEGFDDVFSTYTSQFITVTGIPRCFTGNQLIITDKGDKKISDLQINDKVLSYNEGLDVNEYKSVIDKSFKEKTEKKIYRITMKDGTIIECTEDHRFYTGTSYVEIKDILLNFNKKIEIFNIINN